MHAIDLTIDVTHALGIGTQAEAAVTAWLPEANQLAANQIVCFAFPGGGYCRRYFSYDMRDGTGHGQAGWHVSRGWIFVACDHIGTGDSSVPVPDILTYEMLARVNVATVDAVLERLATGTLLEGYPPVEAPTKLALGQSMGGCILVPAQGQHHRFDAIGVLGFSAVHTVVPSPPGQPTPIYPWIARSGDLTNRVVLNAPALEMAGDTPVVTHEKALDEISARGRHLFAWGFHFDDVPEEFVVQDMPAVRDGDLPPWRSATVPDCTISMMMPGTIACEAAAITCPVLLATGERDVVPDPWLEPKSYRSCEDITVFVCPRMGHMHNFAGTREMFWNRIHAWGDGMASVVSARRFV